MEGEQIVLGVSYGEPQNVEAGSDREGGRWLNASVRVTVGKWSALVRVTVYYEDGKFVLGGDPQDWEVAMRDLDPIAVLTSRQVVLDIARECAGRLAAEAEAGVVAPGECRFADELVEIGAVCGCPVAARRCGCRA